MINQFQKPIVLNMYYFFNIYKLFRTYLFQNWHYKAKFSCIVNWPVAAPVIDLSLADIC